MRRFAIGFLRPKFFQRLLVAIILVLMGLFTVPALSNNSDVYAVEPQVIDSQADTSLSTDPGSTPAAPAPAEPTTGEVKESCMDQSGAVGWIVCPAGSWLTKAIDGIYKVIITLLELKPITADDDSPIYLVWDYARSLSNIVLIIAILVAIVSQVTGFGISNHGIKKILPKLIVSAILINLSYIICTLAVDLSNLIGHSLIGVFDSIRNHIILSGTMSAAANVSLSDLMGPILAGTTLAVVGISLTGGLGAALWLALPILIGGIVAIIAALLTIAARQAVVYLLIMIAPLAFVCYLLPNMEKWMTKWRELFTKMLVLFPLFTLLFGASRLAAISIIASSDNIYHVLLGIAVQIFPLFFAPTLFKMSGSIVGKVNEFARKPFAGAQRGIADYSKVKSAARRDYNANNKRWYKPSSYISDFVEKQKAQAADDAAVQSNIRRGRYGTQASKLKSLVDDYGRQIPANKMTKRQRAALEEKKWAETATAADTIQKESLDTWATAAVAGTIAGGALATTAKQIKRAKQDTRMAIGRSMIDKAEDDALIQDYIGSYADEQKKKFIEKVKLSGGATGLDQLTIGRYLTFEKGVKKLREEAAMELWGKYKNTSEELQTNVQDYLTGKTNSYTLRDYDGTPIAQIGTNAKTDSEFAQILFKNWLERVGDPQALSQMIAYSENHLPADDPRNLVINRKAPGWFKDAKIESAMPFINDYYTSELKDGTFKSEGAIYVNILDNMDKITPKKWSSQSGDSIDFIEKLMNGDFADQIKDFIKKKHKAEKNTDMSDDEADKELTKLINKAATSIISMKLDLEDSTSDQTNFRYDVKMKIASLSKSITENADAEVLDNIDRIEAEKEIMKAAVRKLKNQKKNQKKNPEDPNKPDDPNNDPNSNK